ncbi:hypothetical protein BH10CYA1_BH10CYA1_64830 [soil metagenome]
MSDRSESAALALTTTGGPADHSATAPYTPDGVRILRAERGSLPAGFPSPDAANLVELRAVSAPREPSEPRSDQGGGIIPRAEPFPVTNEQLKAKLDEAVAAYNKVEGDNLDPGKSKYATEAALDKATPIFIAAIKHADATVDGAEKRIREFRLTPEFRAAEVERQATEQALRKAASEVETSFANHVPHNEQANVSQMLSLYGNMKTAQKNAQEQGQKERPEKAALRESLAANMREYGLTGKDNLAEKLDATLEAQRKALAAQQSPVLNQSKDLELLRSKAVQDAGAARVQYSEILMRAGHDDEALFFLNLGFDKMGLPRYPDSPPPEATPTLPPNNYLKSYNYNIA